MISNDPLDLAEAEKSETSFTGAALQRAIGELLTEHIFKEAGEPSEEEVKRAKAKIIEQAKQIGMPPAMAACGYAGRLYQKAVTFHNEHNNEVEELLKQLSSMIGGKGNA